MLEKADHRIVYTPEVYDSFSVTEPDSGRMSFIVMGKVEGLNYFDYTKQHPEETETLFPAIADVARHIWSLPLPPNIPPWVFRARTTRQPVFLRSRRRQGLQRHRGSGRLGQSKADRDKQTGPGQFSISSTLPSHMNLTLFNVLIGKPIILCT